MTPRRLGLLLLLFFIALAVPTSILVFQAYDQLKWEAFHQHQQLAREVTLRIDAGFKKLIEREESRSISDYEFLNVEGADGSAFLQRSPLSRFPLEAGLPGLLGYFQVNASGQLRTPIVPDSDVSNYGISSLELQQRRQLEDSIRDILDQNRLVEKSDSPAPVVMEELEIAEDREDSQGLLSLRDSLGPSVELQQDLGAGESAFEDDRANVGQSAFDELTARKLAPAKSSAPVDQVRDLKLEDSYSVASEAEAEPVVQAFRAKKKAEVKRARKETFNLPQTLAAPAAALEQDAAADDGVSELAKNLSPQQVIRIQTFESEVEPMEFSLLDSGHFVLFRRVWHQDERYVQGILVDQAKFIEQLIEPAFRQSTLSSMSKLIVAHRGAILRDFAADYSRLYQPGARQASNELLYQSRLIAPFSDIELIFTLARFPVGAGGKVIIWSAVILTIILIGGFILLYQLGLRQLALARQQQDFVSAVSHELKTPLTSIRMYGEMLREGWADETKRKTYYDFIYHEAERLTRLINNVLQLARMSRNEQAVKLDRMTVGNALAELRPRLQSQLEPSGFELLLEGDDAADVQSIDIDIDCFIQIFINLVDNAIKFSVNGAEKRIEIRYQRLQDGRIQFAVRDFGPGIAPDQMKKIFKLFYRSENELTRETVGTGIGLALVQQLASAMQAEVDVVNCEPGAEFRIRLRSISASA